MLAGVIIGIVAMFVLCMAGFERTALSIMFPFVAPILLYDWYKRGGRLTD
jgi:hypothetical protein